MRLFVLYAAWLSSLLSCETLQNPTENRVVSSKDTIPSILIRCGSGSEEFYFEAMIPRAISENMQVNILNLNPSSMDSFYSNHKADYIQAIRTFDENRLPKSAAWKTSLVFELPKYVSPSGAEYKRTIAFHPSVFRGQSDRANSKALYSRELYKGRRSDSKVGLSRTATLQCTNGNDLNDHGCPKGFSRMTDQLGGVVLPELEPSFGVGLTGGEIRAVVRSHLNEINHCYLRTLLKTPTASGCLKMHWIVNSMGLIDSADITSSTVDDRSLLSCVSDKIKTWQFPKPRGSKSVKVEYPFSFYLIKPDQNRCFPELGRSQDHCT
jgi:hypothetical protein